MNILIRFLFRLLPDAFIEELNAVSLNEPDVREVIVWAFS